MSTFYTLLHKEIKELITWQIILPILLTTVLFFVIGNVIGKETEKAKSAQTILILDQDQSSSSRTLIDVLNKANFKTELFPFIVTPDPCLQSSAICVHTSLPPIHPEDIIEKAKTHQAKIALVIPAGFGTGIQHGQKQTIETYSIIQNFSITGAQTSALMQAAINAMNSYVSAQLLTIHTSLDPATVLQPIAVKEYVSVGNQLASGNVAAVLAFITNQTMFIPVILLLVIIFAAQMIATAVANEKENKTLETLLSMPVSRIQVVTAKMLASGLVALFSSLVYLIGFRQYINGMTGSISSDTAPIKATVEQLGLSLAPSSYLLLGLSLFMGILVALALAMILGSFAEDIKSVQGLLTPLMVLIMIPYFLALTLDLNQMSSTIQLAVKANPFSHPFMAAPNLFLHNTSAVICGIIYQLAWFIILVSIAAKIFTTDKIFSLKLNFSKKQ